MKRYAWSFREDERAWGCVIPFPGFGSVSIRIHPTGEVIAGSIAEGDGKHTIEKSAPNLTDDNRDLAADWLFEVLSKWAVCHRHGMPSPYEQKLPAFPFPIPVERMGRAVAN